MNEQTKKLILTKVEEGIYLALPDIMNGITHLGEGGKGIERKH